MPRDDKTPRKKSEGGKKKRGGSKKNTDKNATVPNTPEDLDEGQQRPNWLSDADMEALGEKSAAALQRVFDVARRLSGMSESDVEELTKN